MTDKIAQITEKMIAYDKGDIPRIEHFMKVYGYAAAIGKLEKLDPATQEILETAALLHDIGIKVSEEKYQSSAGKYQEIEGPAEARRLLMEAGADQELTHRVCWLIGHHHTYSNIRDIDHQILVEADFLVNMAEEHFSEEAVRHTMDKIFRTKSGISFLKSIWNLIE
mgnify:FL=1